MRLLVTILTTLLLHQGFGQDIPIGHWRYHVPYHRMSYVVKADQKVYCASEDGMFYYDISDNSVNPISKVDGLSDIKISTLAYHSGLDYLIIGYESGNLDLLNDDIIYNINDIERKNILGSKRINHVYLKGTTAYISTDFGVVVFNLVTREIKETYGNIGPSGTQLEVYSTTINDSKDSIFIATSNGIMAASSSASINRLDFNNWITYDQPGDSIATTGVSSLITYNDTVYAPVEGDYLKAYNGNYWTRTSLDLSAKGTIYSATLTNDRMSICTNSELVEVISTNQSNTISTSTYTAPRQSFFDESDNLWIADGSFGLVSNFGGSFFAMRPNGPRARTSFNLSYHDNIILMAAGGFGLGSYLPNYSNTGFFIYEEGKWDGKSVFSANHPGSRDITDGIYNEVTDSYYLSSYLDGIMTWNPSNNTYTVINDTTAGSTLVAFGGTQNRVVDLHVDEDQNIWVASHVSNLGQPSLHRIDPAGNMKGFSFTNSNAKVPLEIVIDPFNNKWMRLGGTGGLRGIYVFNENDINNNSDDQEKYLGTSNNLPDADVKAIAVDKNGEIWCGTNQGVAVFFNPSQVFTSNIQASTPIFDFRPLLKEESVTAIKVDGGNRKWIGTQNGVWLFNENGTKEVFHFNKDNSPLPSNTILDIEINDITGEVFFATDEGLVSWRGTSTESSGVNHNVKVFPNPVLPDFDGTLAISGLAPNSIVKITDISGKLIYETDSYGGTATWNIRGLNNQRAKTGVYLIYSTSDDGEEAFVGKVAVID